MIKANLIHLRYNMWRDRGFGPSEAGQNEDIFYDPRLRFDERLWRDVMVRMAGAKQLAVADALVMSEHTLRNHLTTIYSKLAVRNRLELHVFATEHGLAEADVRRRPS